MGRKPFEERKKDVAIDTYNVGLTIVLSSALGMCFLIFNWV